MSKASFELIASLSQTPRMFHWGKFFRFDNRLIEVPFFKPPLDDIVAISRKLWFGRGNVDRGGEAPFFSIEDSFVEQKGLKRGIVGCLGRNGKIAALHGRI